MPTLASRKKLRHRKQDAINRKSGKGRKLEKSLYMAKLASN